MKAGWDTAKLAKLCSVFTDGNWIESKDQSTDGIRLVQTGNVGFGEFKDRRDKARFIDEETFNRLKCFEVLPGDCLISRLPDPVGRACHIPETGDKMITAVDCSIVRADPKKLDRDYFIFYSQSRQYLKDVDALCSGTTRRRISRKNLGATKIPLPPLEEQKQIVAVLEAAFEGLTRARTHIETNLQNARELFASNVNNLFQAAKTENPSQPIGELAPTITKGSSPKWQGVDYVDEPGVLFVTSENVGTNQLLFAKTKYVDEVFNTKDKKSILARGDVLTNIVGASIGRTAVFERDDIANINQAVCLIRCNPALLSNYYLCYLLNSPFFKEKLHEAEVDNARANLSLTFFRNFAIPLPSLTDQQNLVAKIDNLRTETDQLEAAYKTKLQDLDDLRQSLLQKAFAGELT